MSPESDQPFFTLPIELREMIYRLVILEPSGQSLGFDTSFPQNLARTPNLIQVCRKIRSEAFPLFLGENCFTVDCIDHSQVVKFSKWMVLLGDLARFVEAVEAILLGRSRPRVRHWSREPRLSIEILAYHDEAPSEDRFDMEEQRAEATVDGFVGFVARTRRSSSETASDKSWTFQELWLHSTSSDQSVQALKKILELYAPDFENSWILGELLSEFLRLGVRFDIGERVDIVIQDYIPPTYEY